MSEEEGEGRKRRNEGGEGWEGGEGREGKRKDGGVNETGEGRKQWVEIVRGGGNKVGRGWLDEIGGGGDRRVVGGVGGVVEVVEIPRGPAKVFQELFPYLRVEIHGKG